MKKRSIRDELGFTNQNWRRVLKEIVNFAPNRFGRGKTNYGVDNELVELLKINPQELTLIMSFLEEQGLIEYDGSEYNWINLTSKGFDVALQNQSQSTAFRTNFVVVLLTAVIAFATAVNVFSGISDWAIKSVTIAFIIGLGLIFWGVTKRTV